MGDADPAAWTEEHPAIAELLMESPGGQCVIWVAKEDQVNMRFPAESHEGTVNGEQFTSRRGVLGNLLAQDWATVDLQEGGCPCGVWRGREQRAQGITRYLVLDHGVSPLEETL